MRAKVTIVGAGMTGGTMAQRLAETGFIDVVLQDIVEGLPQGKSLDLAEAGPIVGFNARITGSNDWATPTAPTSSSSPPASPASPA